MEVLTWVVCGTVLVAGIAGAVYMVRCALTAVPPLADAAEDTFSQYGMATICEGVGDVDPETEAELRQCQEAHDRLVEAVCGGGQ